MKKDITNDEARRAGRELAGKLVDMCIASEEDPKSIGFAFAGAVTSFMCALGSDYDTRMELFDAWATLTRGRVANASSYTDITGQLH